MPRFMEAALQTMAAAVNAGDAAGYAGVYAPNATITIYGGVTLRGADANPDYEVALLTQFPGTRFAFLSVWQAGSVCVAHYAVAGQAMGHEGLLFFQFDPMGRIVEEHRYLDSLTPMAQLGMLGVRAMRPIPSLPRGTDVYTASGSPVERRNLASVMSSIEAFDSGDERAFLTALTSEPTVDEMVYADSFAGQAAVTDWLRTWRAARASSEIVSAIPVENFVLMESVVRGTLDGVIAGVRASDQPFLVHRAAVFELQDDRVARIRAFMNGKELAEAVGDWPPRDE